MRPMQQAAQTSSQVQDAVCAVSPLGISQTRVRCRSLLQLFPALGHGLRQATRDHRQLPPHSNSLQQRYCSSFDLGKGQTDVVRHLAPFPFTGKHQAVTASWKINK
ncbi:cardiac phospholamban isoform X5 [Tympanuchus pallidicinctus]|uniref:cardiac phospholamban isoform X5 n=1 Tax=Tympanuchus pallidicinctus TaxID=109042 RepID=UPI002286FC7E|nr:cardiac phospholamban isoform X5 [Tympanuchus pallidicinctus]